ncbi:MAG: dienelactone hydrolase family protein [Actinobacteria bacterium]|nr:dienelactone hydrolase family protein [Actinomycetota bacterium]
MEKIDTPAGPVSVAFDGPHESRVLLVLAPGAGAPMDSDFMRDVASMIAADGVRVCRFNFVYQELGRKAPDRQNVLEDTYRAVIGGLRPDTATLVAGGKSLGGRIASMVAAAGADVDGLVFLGYPLHPPGKPERIRKSHLPSISVPMLFVEGTRDPFCPLATLEDVRAELTAPNEVAVIDDGDHSFKVRKTSGRSTSDSWAEVAAATATWLRETF